MTKRNISDRIILGLQDAFPNIDFDIDEREVFLVIDDIVNEMAVQNYLSNWKAGVTMVDESYVTEWSGDNAIAVVDVPNEPSYLTLPAIPVALPMNGGLLEIWPQNNLYGAVRVTRHEDARMTRNLMSGNYQGDLAGALSYINGVSPRFVFNQASVGANYAATFGLRLAIRNSSTVGVNDPFPVAPDILTQVIANGIEYFTEKRMKVTDTVRDAQDALKRN